MGGPSEQPRQGAVARGVGNDVGGLDAEDACEDRAVDRSEVDAGAQVALVEVPERRRVAVEAGTDLATAHEDRTGAAVVGPVAAVHRDPPADLAVDEDGDRAVRHPLEEGPRPASSAAMR